MSEQLGFFAAPPDEPVMPEGFRYQADIIGAGEERAVVRDIGQLPFREFEFHGYTGKRRIVSFGWQYDFAASTLRKVDDIPPFLQRLRETAAAFAGLQPASLQHVLVTEYGAGAGIGWHRDKAVFGDVIGFSLLAPCVFRLRRQEASGWSRASITVEPRSAYLLRGPSGTVWEHSIPPVGALRYSLTFRNLRGHCLAAPSAGEGADS